MTAQESLTAALTGLLNNGDAPPCRANKATLNRWTSDDAEERAWAVGLLPTDGGHGADGGYGGSDSPLIEPPSKPPHLPKQTAITATTARTATPNSRICDCGETLAAGRARCDTCRRKMGGAR